MRTKKYKCTSCRELHSRAHTICLGCERRIKRAALEKLKVTEEEKVRWADSMVRTWQAIAPDALQACRVSGQRATVGIVVEYVVDANRMQMFAGMTDEEEEFFLTAMRRPSVKRWVYTVMRGYAQ